MSEPARVRARGRLDAHTLETCRDCDHHSKCNEWAALAWEALDDAARERDAYAKNLEDAQSDIAEEIKDRELSNQTVVELRERVAALDRALPTVLFAANFARTVPEFRNVYPALGKLEDALTGLSDQYPWLRPGAEQNMNIYP